MTLYFTDTLSPEEIVRAKKSGKVFAVKLYPAGATTNSDNGVTSIEKVYPTLKAMEEQGLVLCVHSEVTDTTVDLFDREAVFIERHLRPLIKAFPDLKVVLEHVTTADAVQFVMECGPNVGATITAHHLLYNRNAIFAGGLQPHYYCLPVLKRERHRQALLQAAKSGNPKFFLGTDSAPHKQSEKERACGCAGIYTAHAAMNLYAEAFEQIGEISKLQAFASENGANFYGLPLNETGMKITKRTVAIPASYPFAGGKLVPLRAGKTVVWDVELLKSAPLVGGMGSVGPAWARGEMEKPAGTKDMGTWQAQVYTEEQQARLGIDEMGNKK